MKSNQSSSRTYFSVSRIATAIRNSSFRMMSLSSCGLIGLSVSQLSIAALTINENGEIRHFQQYNYGYNQNTQQNTQETYEPYEQYNIDGLENGGYYPSNDTVNSDTSSYTPKAFDPNVSSSVFGAYGDSVNYFDEARRAAARGDTSALYQFEQQMQGGIFAMYPEYWRLDNNMSSLSPSTVISFVKRYPNTVMAEKLVADFAENRAGSGDYAAVRTVAPYIQNADSSEACALAIGEIHGGGSNILTEQKSKVWLNTLKQPTLCDQFARELSSSSFVKNSDRQERLYRMLRTDKTGDIMSLSSSLGVPIQYQDLQSIQYDQNDFLNRFAYEPYSEKNQYLYLYTIGKMAEKSYREAAMQLDFDIRQDDQRQQPLLSEETRKMAYRSIAVKRMNMNTDDGFNAEAVTWFRNSLGLAFNYEEAEDYAMAGIRFNEWQDVITAITSMSDTYQKQDSWQYWLARAHEQTGNKRKAQHIYKQVAQKSNYYGYLAKDKVGRSVDLSSMGGASLPDITDDERSRMLKNPSFARAFALHGVNINYAKREWNWGVQQALKNKDQAMITAAARHAHDIGWYDRSIYAIEKANESIGMLSAAIGFPMPRQSSVVYYSQQAGVDPAWAYGIMRQESRFNVGAVSTVGANGLMQVMPGTGKYVARKLGESYNAKRVNTGDTNIRYGTWYMGDIMNQLDGQASMATAGYNAGPSKAKRWQPVFGTLAADQYVETIAYPETRNYVKRVMENSTVYGSLLGNPKQISQRMGIVPPKY